MSARLDPLALFERLRSTYWFLPAVVTGTAVALGLGLVAIDQAYPSDASWLGWAYGGGADGARSLLSAVAGSTITVVSVTFSVMVVALTVSSQHFGPRLLNSFMRDNPAQLVLGTFTGTFAYCLVVLRTVQSGDNVTSVFVPHLAVSAAVVLTLISVAMLIYYVHHVALSMQVSEITSGVAREMERVVGRLYPEHFGEGADPAGVLPPVPDGAMPICARASGYVQQVNSEAVLKLASRYETTVWLLARPGDFIIEGTRIAAAHPAPADRDKVERGIGGAYLVGSDRTSFQDVGFTIQQLVEVALRGLSPGVNEPFTSITCVDRLGQGLSKLATRKIPSGLRADADGAVRVVTKPRTFVELLEGAFLPLAPYAGKEPGVADKIFETLTLLAGLVRRPEDREAIGRAGGVLWSSVASQVRLESDRAALARRNAELRRKLEWGESQAEAGEAT